MTERTAAYIAAVALATSNIAASAEKPKPRRRASITIRIHLSPSAEETLHSGRPGAFLKLVDEAAPLLVSCDKRGRTPLHYAAGTGNVELARGLIERGADVDLTGMSTFTPLHAAVEHVEVVKLLLDNGADTTVRCCCGRTPLQLAAYKGLGAAVDLLIARGIKLDPVSAICAGRVTDVAAIVKERPALAAATRLDGWPGEGTALQIAGRMDKAEVVKALIEGGAAVDQAVPWGMRSRVPPLVVAVLGGERLAVMRVLLEAGADPNVMVPPSGCATFGRAHAGARPLLRVARDRREKRVVELLLRYGAREDFEPQPKIRKPGETAPAGKTTAAPTPAP